MVIATPPHFRPIHFEAAVEAGKHIFMEKPLATDAPGVRRVLATNEKAKKKDLMVAVGLQRRHDPRYVETIKRIHDGAIGDFVNTRVYWNDGGLWVAAAEAGANRNGIPDAQLVLLHLAVRRPYRRAAHPQFGCRQLAAQARIRFTAQGMGGRQVRTGKEYGQIFDHHAVEYTFADGTKMFSQCRHIDGCANEVREHAAGTKGTLDIDDGAWRLHHQRKTAKWHSPGKKLDNHHQEHHDLFAALRDGRTYNEVQYGAESTMTAILGRMATYSGKIVKWDEALAKGSEFRRKDLRFFGDAVRCCRIRTDFIRCPCQANSKCSRVNT